MSVLNCAVCLYGISGTLIITQCGRYICKKHIAEEYYHDIMMICCHGCLLNSYRYQQICDHLQENLDLYQTIGSDDYKIYKYEDIDGYMSVYSTFNIKEHQEKIVNKWMSKIKRELYDSLNELMIKDLIKICHRYIY